ncbi:MAG: hypothetical protein Q4D96_02860 [Propionibacteriaceae bacterium]|nr:hypothetical protein [Propionibacteriaceae bacterium]
MRHLAQTIPTNPGTLIGRASPPCPDHRPVWARDVPARRTPNPGKEARHGQA